MIFIGGAYFFYLGVYAALGIYSIVLMGGIINGVLPAMKTNKEIY
jgi:hypothetical protein